MPRQRKPNWKSKWTTCMHNFRTCNLRQGQPQRRWWKLWQLEACSPCKHWRRQRCGWTTNWKHSMARANRGHTWSHHNFRVVFCQFLPPANVTLQWPCEECWFARRGYRVWATQDLPLLTRARKMFLIGFEMAADPMGFREAWNWTLMKTSVPWWLVSTKSWMWSLKTATLFTHGRRNGCMEWPPAQWRIAVAEGSAAAVLSKGGKIQRSTMGHGPHRDISVRVAKIMFHQSRTL